MTLLYKLLYLFKLTEYKLSMLMDRAVINHRLKGHERKQVKLADIKSILLVRNDGIGDMVITTAMIRVLTLQGYQVSVISQKSSLEIIKNNPHVKETFVWDDKLPTAERDQLETEIRSRQFDLAIDMRYPVYFKRKPHLNMLCHYFGAKYTLGWNKSAMSFIDASINHYTRRGHYITLVQKFLKFLNIHNANLSYELFIDEQAQQNAITFIEHLKSKGSSHIILLNPYTGHHRRDMSEQQIQASIKLITEKQPHATFVAIGIESRIKALVDKINLPNFTYYSSKSILDVAPLIEHADLIITPDTSIVHVTAVYQKPLVALYASGRRTPAQHSSVKNQIKERYHELADYARAVFFDKPRLDDRTRTVGKILLVENSFGPNNPNAIQLKNYSHNLSEISPQEIAQAVTQLLKS